MIGFGVYAAIDGGCYLISRWIGNIKYGPGAKNVWEAIEKEGRDSPRVKHYQTWNLNSGELATFFGVAAGVLYILWRFDL